MNTGYHAHLLPLDFLPGTHRACPRSSLLSSPLVRGAAALLLVGVLMAALHPAAGSVEPGWTRGLLGVFAAAWMLRAGA